LAIHANVSRCLFRKCHPEINPDVTGFEFPVLLRGNSGKEHRVPLSARALAILQEMLALRTAGDADAQVSFLLALMSQRLN
jgi:hypothetical protein